MRILYTMQYFQGKRESARLCLLAMAFMCNFDSYEAKTPSELSAQISSFTDLNG